MSRTSSACRRSGDGCVIFYKLDKFKLSVVRAVEYKSDTISFLSSYTVSLVCKLIPWLSITTPLVATTHLLYTVNKEHARVCQAGPRRRLSC